MENAIIRFSEDHRIPAKSLVRPFLVRRTSGLGDVRVNCTPLRCRHLEDLPGTNKQAPEYKDLVTVSVSIEPCKMTSIPIC